MYLGNYRTISKLGAGAMGDVYLAEHARIGVPYAVKVLPEAMAADQEARERFVSEARVMAMLRHPNIVQVHNMDVAGDVHYIVMDFVSPDNRNPKTLDDLLKERGGCLPEGEVGRILGQVCEALIYSHSQGVIHCDVKPSNILFDKGNVVRVSDFGLAKIMGNGFIQQSIAMSLSGSLGAGRTIAPQQQAASAEDSLGAGNTLGGQGSSRAESIVGTFHYMPPEVRNGGEWTIQGDIYSVGVLVYVLLVGQHPVGRWKMPSDIIKGIPIFWDALIDRALEPKPQDRFQTTRELLDALQQVPNKLKRPASPYAHATTRTDVPESVVEMVHIFVEEQKGQWDHLKYLEFLVQVYKYPAHAGLSKEVIGAVLESEKSAWLKQEAQRKENAARLARAQRMVGEEAKQRHKDAGEVLRKAEEAKKSAECLRRAEEVKKAELVRHREEKITRLMTASTHLLQSNLPKKRNWLTVSICGIIFISLIFLLSSGKKNGMPTPVSPKETELSLPKPDIIPMPENLSKNTQTNARSVKTIQLPDNVPMDFIQIPAGEFTMGDDKDSEVPEEQQPQHRVTFTKDFWLGKYEVTQAQWKAVMGKNPSLHGGDSWLLSIKDHYNSKGTLPVEQVSWNDCQTFIKKLNKLGEGTFRLPSESEWEYACRAGTTTTYFFGDTESQVNEYAWHSENSDTLTHPVGQKKPNSWGLYDMNGNVSEWCQDWFHKDYTGAPTDGSSWEAEAKSPWESEIGESRVIRGGAYYNHFSFCKSASRGYLSWSPDDRDKGYGLRLVWME